MRRLNVSLVVLSLFFCVGLERVARANLNDRIARALEETLKEQLSLPSGAEVRVERESWEHEKSGLEQRCLVLSQRCAQYDAEIASLQSQRR